MCMCYNLQTALTWCTVGFHRWFCISWWILEVVSRSHLDDGFASWRWCPAWDWLASSAVPSVAPNWMRSTLPSAAVEHVQWNRFSADGHWRHKYVPNCMHWGNSLLCYVSLLMLANDLEREKRKGQHDHNMLICTTVILHVALYVFIYILRMCR